MKPAWAVQGEGASAGEEYSRCQHSLRILHHSAGGQHRRAPCYLALLFSSTFTVATSILAVGACIGASPGMMLC